MNRRRFLGLFGCGVIGFAWDWSGAPITPPTLPGRGYLYDLQLSWPVHTPPGVSVLDLVRADMNEVPLLRCALRTDSFWRWIAMPGGAIVFREGAGLDLQPQIGVGQSCPVRVPPDWAMLWATEGIATVTGCAYCGTPYFDWPAGGKCRRCGGRLPAPLQNLSGRFHTSRRDGIYHTVALEPWHATPDVACAYCGVQMVAGRCIDGCGGGNDQNP